MLDYKEGKIYKIYNDEIPDKVYYGSTCNTLVKRLYNHKVGFGKDKKKCTSSVLFPGAKIVLVEKFPCNDKDELRKRERFYIENNKCVNIVIPGRSKKEWHKDNKGTKEYVKKRKEYYKKNKEKIKKYGNEYRLENKEKIKERKKEAYEKGKGENEYIKKRKEKIECDICKCMINKMNFQRHCKTKKHLNNL